MKKIIKWGLIGFVTLIVLGAVASGGKSSTQSSTSSSLTSTDQQKAETKDLTPKVGDSTRLGDREFTVNSVKRSQGFGYNTPKSGKEFITVKVTISNLGTDEVSYNPFDFKVQDANGAQEGTVTATYSLDDHLNSGTLAPKGKVSGSLVFEVTKNDHASLIFQPSFWSSQRVVVDLGDK